MYNKNPPFFRNAGETGKTFPTQSKISHPKWRLPEVMKLSKTLRCAICRVFTISQGSLGRIREGCGSRVFFHTWPFFFGLRFFLVCPFAIFIAMKTIDEKSNIRNNANVSTWKHPNDPKVLIGVWFLVLEVQMGQMIS